MSMILSPSLTYMLTQGSHDEATFLTSTSILKKSVNKSLFYFCATLTLATGNFDQRLVDCSDG